MGKKAKEHNKKVAKRNEQILLERKRYQKFQNKILNELMEKQKQEQQAQEANKIIGVDAPTLTEFNGPII
jgi:hypothetical protein